MGRAVLIDEKTLAVAVGNTFQFVDPAELDSALKDKTDIGVVPCEVIRVVAASEDSLHRQAAERLPEGTVYCHERLEGASYQLFSMPEPLLQLLRQSRRVRSVVPYALLAREGRRGALSSFSAVMTGDYGIVTRAGRAIIGGGESDGESTRAAVEDYAVVDIVGDRPVISAIHGSEIRTTRALHPDDAVQREIFVTLQGANMPNAKIITHHRKLGDRLREAGRDVDVVRLPANTPTIGLHGLKKIPETQFYLPAELARIQRRKVRRKLWRSVLSLGVVFFLATGIAVVCAARRLLAESELRDLQAQRMRSNSTHAKLFRERYGSLLVKRTIDVPQSWAELEMIIPVQLTVGRISYSQNNVVAELLRRKDNSLQELGIDAGFSDPPLAIRDLKQALSMSPAWRGARVRLVIDTHELSYVVEKVFGPTNP